jgi:cellulose synthase/poly-beta-1,6-N-acetylglucosamine synthase-like glycosyltransferase
MAEPERVDASILVPVRNEEAHIAQTARSILGQRFDGSYEVLFIDGRSEDGTREQLERIAADDPRVRILDNPARVTPHALNIGLRAARGDVIVRMDAHTFYPDHYLQTGIERLRRGDVAWVSGPQLPVAVDRGSARVALALSTRLGTGGATFRHAGTGERESISGFTGLFARGPLEELGGWDEEWVINQDAELGARYVEAGHRIVVLPELAAQYVPRNTLRALARQYARYGFYRVKTSLRHPWSMRRAHLLPPLVAATVAAAALPGPQRRLARAGVAGYAAALGLTAAAAVRRAGIRDAAALPLVLATMHLAWGAGFLVACVRLGPPVAGVAAALRPSPTRPAPAPRRARG